MHFNERLQVKTMTTTTIKELMFPNGGNYLWGALAGNGNATKRQSIVLVVTGNKLPKAKCGYNFVREVLIKHFNISQAQCSGYVDRDLVRTINGETRISI